MAKKTVSVDELTRYEPDPQPYSTPEEKNDRLAELMKGTWNALAIVSVRRIEIGGSGWEATYRKVR